MGRGNGREGGRNDRSKKMGRINNGPSNRRGAVRSASEFSAYAETSDSRDFRRELGLPAVGTSNECRDFRRRETEKHLNLHEFYHVEQKYDGH